MSLTQGGRHGEELVRRFAAAIRGTQLYAPGHPIVGRALDALAEVLGLVHAAAPSITIGMVGDDLVVGDVPVPRAAENMGDLMRRLQLADVERIAIDRGVPQSELAALVGALARGDGTEVSRLELTHVRVGKIGTERQAASGTDIAGYKQLFTEAVSVAETLWESARVEGVPDADAATSMIDSLAQAVAENRTALMALTALKDYDNYTFTHMVNVSILTMAQARGLAIEGPLLREFGLAALMHDIGKVKTPTEILSKPDQLSDREFDIMKRHTVDGAEILRRTPEIPTLAPVVAFEHHLRADGTGYPSSVSRPTLNLGTTLCGIADVYDAMRSRRIYQDSFPTDRILAVLQRNNGEQFDQNLVRRFAQLVGIFPVGNLVRLDTEEIAVVLKAYAPDPYRPLVRVVMASDGSQLAQPYDVHLWAAREGEPRSVQAPLDPAAYAIDPLSYL